jgi:DNA-binding response OmpR family regulator
LQYDITTAAQAGGARAQILIIADDPLMQRVLKRTFCDQDYAVIICREARAGLGAFRTEQPAAVILDLMLPDITGRELCKMMKAEQPEIPVIVVSAISEVDDKVLLLEIGADEYVIKPFSPRELIARLERAIRSDRSR